jgi:hypothetical protein
MAAGVLPFVSAGAGAGVGLGSAAVAAAPFVLTATAAVGVGALVYSALPEEQKASVNEAMSSATQFVGGEIKNLVADKASPLKMATPRDADADADADAVEYEGPEPTQEEVDKQVRDLDAVLDEYVFYEGRPVTQDDDDIEVIDPGSDGLPKYFGGLFK